MGLCLSCIRPEDDSENEYNENSSLLRNHHLYLDENIQEDLLKQQQRQSELNGIVNDLSDKLIDVTNFLGNPSYSTGLVGAPNLSFLSPSLHGQSNPDDLAEGLPDAKTYPYLLTDSEKLKILRDVADLDPYVKKSAQIPVSEPLYLKF